MLTIYNKLKIMKHILNDLTEQEKNSIREQHTGGMKVMTESFSKLINSKLGDVKPILSEQGFDMIGVMVDILTKTQPSAAKVKELCDLCKKSKAQPHGRSNRFADIIRDATQEAGTDEEAIYHVFNSMEQQVDPEAGELYFDEFCSLVKSYKDSYNIDLYTDLSHDLNGEAEWAKVMRPIRDLLTLDSYKKTSSRDGGQSNQTTSMPTRPTPPIPQPTGPSPRMNESFSKLINSKLGDVKPMVNEQLGTDEGPKKFLEGYSNKLSNILKGKTFNVVAKSSDGEYVYPVIKFTGFADRDHTQDNQPIQNIKIFDFISSAIIVDPSGLEGFRKNQKVYVSFNLIFDKGKFVKFGEITMYDESFKNSVKLFGWTDEDFDGGQNLNLHTQSTVQYS
jgi:hypothetical protein